MTILSLLVGAVIDLLITTLALTAVAAYLAWLLRTANRAATRMAHTAEHHRTQAAGWRSDYYTVRDQLVDVQRRISQLTAALECSTDLITYDRQVIAELEAQFRETAPDQEL